MNILIWNERSPEEQSAAIHKAYPDGMQAAIADIFKNDADINIKIGWQSQPENGLSAEVLADTDVLLYWAHALHNKLDDAAAERIAARVNDGMGAVFLHSAHVSKPFTRLIGASGSLHWREDERHERLYNLKPSHPIASGVPCEIYLPQEEMYGEPFDCGEPDDVIFVGWFPGGEIFRSGNTYTVGKGRVFYLQPGHETFPTYYNKDIAKIIHNGVMWAVGNAPDSNPYKQVDECIHSLSKEKTFGLFGRKK